MKKFEIKGYEDRYSITDSFEIIAHSKKRKDGYIFKEKIMRQRIGGSGYPMVSLIDSKGKKKSFLIHRLIAQSFIPNPDKKRCVNHINGIKTDNRIENLEWVTSKENNIHALSNGLRKKPSMPKGELSVGAKLVLDVHTGIFYGSMVDAAYAKGLNAGTVRATINNKKKFYHGLIYV